MSDSDFTEVTKEALLEVIESLRDMNRILKEGNIRCDDCERVKDENKKQRELIIQAVKFIIKTPAATDEQMRELIKWLDDSYKAIYL